MTFTVDTFHDGTVYGYTLYFGIIIFTEIDELYVDKDAR